MEQNHINKKHLLIALGISLFAAIGWTLSTANGLYMDDWSIIGGRIGKLPSELFSILPRSRYNNRPVGEIFVMLLHQIFGINSQGYHFVFVIIHLVNVYLVYEIAKLFFKRFSVTEVTFSPILAAAIFGAYPQSIMAVQWVAAVYDMLCCFFMLCSLYCFLKKDAKVRYYGFYSMVSFFTYILSLRAKEMSLLLPLVFLLLDLDSSQRRNQRIHISKVTGGCIVWLMVYLISLFSFPATTGAYQQSFSVISLLKNVFRYIGIYFDLGTGSMTFSEYTASMYFGIFVIIAIVVYSVVEIKRKKRFLAFMICFTGFMLAPVLLMSNMQHKLYLYIPSVFIAMMFSYLATVFWGKYKSFGSIVLILVLSIGAVNYFPGPVLFRNWWCSASQKDAKQLSQIYRFGELPKYCHIYVKGADQEYNVVSPYGPGNSIKALYNRDDIVCEVVDEFPEDPQAPYAFWKYQNGSFEEIAKEYSHEVNVESVSYTWWSENEIALGVTCEPIVPDMQICINGEEYPTTVGEQFISAIYSCEGEEFPMTLHISLTSEELGDIAVEETVLVIEKHS